MARQGGDGGSSMGPSGAGFAGGTSSSDGLSRGGSSSQMSDESMRGGRSSGFQQAPTYHDPLRNDGGGQSSDAGADPAISSAGDDDGDDDKKFNEMHPSKWGLFHIQDFIQTCPKGIRDQMTQLIKDQGITSGEALVGWDFDSLQKAGISNKMMARSVIKKLKQIIEKNPLPVKKQPVIPKETILDDDPAPPYTAPSSSGSAKKASKKKSSTSSSSSSKKGVGSDEGPQYPVDDAWSKRGLVGLYNQINTCYMNSAFQVLLHTAPFVKLCLDAAAGVPKEILNPKDTEYEDESGGGSKSWFSFGGGGASRRGRRDFRIRQTLGLEWLDFVVNVHKWKDKWDKKRHVRIFTPRGIREHLGRRDATFTSGRQEDAFAVVNEILTALDDEWSQGEFVKIKRDIDGNDVSRETEIQVAEDLMRLMLERGSPIEKMFNGIEMDVTTCLQCHTESRCWRPFRAMAMPLVQGATRLTLRIMYRGVLIPDCIVSINGGITGAVLEFSVRDFLFKSKNPALAFYNECDGNVSLNFAILGWTYQKGRKETVYGARVTYPDAKVFPDDKKFPIVCMVTDPPPESEENPSGQESGGPEAPETPATVKMLCAIVAKGEFAKEFETSQPWNTLSIITLNVATYTGKTIIAEVKRQLPGAMIESAFKASSKKIRFELIVSDDVVTPNKSVLISNRSSKHVPLIGVFYDSSAQLQLPSKGPSKLSSHAVYEIRRYLWTKRYYLNNLRTAWDWYAALSNVVKENEDLQGVFKSKRYRNAERVVNMDESLGGKSGMLATNWDVTGWSDSKVPQPSHFKEIRALFDYFGEFVSFVRAVKDDLEMIKVLSAPAESSQKGRASNNLCTSLGMCWNEYHATKILSHTSRSYSCPVCQKQSPMIHWRKEILQLPKVLVFQLDRYDDDDAATDAGGAMYEYHGQKFKVSARSQKHGHLVEYATEFEIQGKVYDLAGVTVHKGMDTRAGHYVARIRSMYNGEWIVMNDDRVSGPKKRFMVDDGATVLIYTHNKKKSREAKAKKAREAKMAKQRQVESDERKAGPADSVEAAQRKRQEEDDARYAQQIAQQERAEKPRSQRRGQPSESPHAMNPDPRASGSGDP